MVYRETIEVIGGGIVEKRIWVGGDRLLNPYGLSDVNLCFTAQAAPRLG
jgi:hypothetical protein